MKLKEKEELSRFEKCKIALELGYKVEIDKGIVIGLKGKEIKTKSSDGYIRIDFTYNGKIYNLKAHHFIYYCKYGEYPIKLQINHLNEIKDDNRICNLKLATNRENVSYSSENSTGFIGIKKQGKKYSSSLFITINNLGKDVYIGMFNTPYVASSHRELAILFERTLESHSKEHVKEFRDFIKNLYIENFVD
jgi:hypothetical protein